MVGGDDLLLSFLDGVGEGGRYGLGVRCPGRRGLHVGKSAVSERFSYILGEVERHGVKNEIGDGALSESLGPGMDRAVGVELWELFGELGKEPLAGALEAAGAAHVRNLSRSWSCLMPP